MNDEPFIQIRPSSPTPSENSSPGDLQPTQTSSGTTWYKATFLVINAALGAGLLNFPLAFEETGGVVAGNVAHVVRSGK